MCCQKQGALGSLLSLLMTMTPPPGANQRRMLCTLFQAGAGLAAVSIWLMDSGHSMRWAVPLLHMSSPPAPLLFLHSLFLSSLLSHLPPSFLFLLCILYLISLLPSFIQSVYSSAVLGSARGSAKHILCLARHMSNEGKAGEPVKQVAGGAQTIRPQGVEVTGGQKTQERWPCGPRQRRAPDKHGSSLGIPER